MTSAANLEGNNGRYSISTDPARLDFHAVHAYLTEAYWARGRAYETVVRAVQHSLCFGLYDGDAQIGFARVITDYTLFSYLCDVYILDGHQGQGLGVWLIRTVLEHPELQSVRRWTLATSDAHGFYARFGFAAMANTDKYMEMRRDAQS